jgi:hypothetical protein
MKLGHEAPRKKARNEERCAHEESCRLLKPAAERPPVWRSRFVLEERRRSTRCRTPALATGCLKPLFSYTGTQTEHSQPGRIFFSCRRRLPRTCEGARASRSHAVRSGGAGENGPGGGALLQRNHLTGPGARGSRTGFGCSGQTRKSKRNATPPVRENGARWACPCGNNFEGLYALNQTWLVGLIEHLPGRINHEGLFALHQNPGVAGFLL